jgi:hypothetical protein
LDFHVGGRGATKYSIEPAGRLGRSSVHMSVNGRWSGSWSGKDAGEDGGLVSRDGSGRSLSSLSRLAFLLTRRRKARAI